VSLPGTGEKVGAFVLPDFPRRGAWLGLRVYGPGGKVSTADFRVRNPAPGPYPIWHAGSLPQTQREGPLAFSLIHLTTGNLPYGRGIGTQALFRVSVDGRPTQSWVPVGIILSDATGNLLVPSGLQRAFVNGGVQLQFPGYLPKSEAAWKARAEFVPAGGFATGDLLMVRSLGIPGGSLPSATTFWVTRDGVRQRLEVKLFSAPQWLKGRLLVQVQAAPVDGVRIGLVRATDERGRTWLPVHRGPMEFFPSRTQTARNELKISSPRHMTVLNGGWKIGVGYELRLPADVRRLSLTFAVVKSRYVEFVAKPS
jgi:hypothetical protein